MKVVRRSGLADNGHRCGEAIATTSDSPGYFHQNPMVKLHLLMVISQAQITYPSTSTSMEVYPRLPDRL
jgi:hypothetical protein